MRRSPSLLPLSSLSTLILCILIFCTLTFASAPDRLTGPIVSGQTVRLRTGVPMQARHGSDEGLVDPSLKLSYITLLTVPSAAQKRALTKLLAEQQDRHSASYHKWLTPEEYADRFGLSTGDVQKITGWLQSQGFTIVRTARGRNWIAFSGTAAQVQKTFQTEIHNLKVKGEAHFANSAPPAIPAAFSGVVAGLRGLNDFRPQSQLQRAKPSYTFPLGGKNYLFLAPGDIKTMYDINTLYSNGIDGTGQTLAVMGETGIYQSDLTNFRQNFGLTPISCTVNGSNIITACNTSNFKYVLVNGSATSIFGDLPEADLDIEWSGATARSAKIIFVNAPIGGFVWDAWYYAVDNNVAPVITMSYTSPCEIYEAGPFTGEGSILSDEAELAKANAEGITFMNSSGDTGAAECDDVGITGTNTAIDGYAVAYPASSQYVTGVGGTLIPTTEYTGTYFGSSNGVDGGSALSYVPEQAWNDSQEWGVICTPADPCTFGQSTVTDWLSAQNVLGIAAGGGGVSNCVTVDSNFVCTGGFPQPAWQAGLVASAINPNGLGQANSSLSRFSPDVSLAASANFPGYLVCTQLSAIGGTGTGSSCDSPTTGVADMLTACINGTNSCSIFGGTSVSSPIFAGMVALLNQDVVANGIQPAPGLGNINPTLYSLAKDNASNGAFNPVTTSASGIYSNGAWCAPGTPTSGVTGDPWPAAMQCPSSGSPFLGFNSYNFDAATNYNLVTGLGSVNASHLAAAIVGQGDPTTTTLRVDQNPAKFGATVTFAATVTTTGTNAPTGTVTFNDGSSSIGTGTLATVGGNQVATLAISTLTVGVHSITAVYGGDSNNASSTSPVLMETITAPTLSVTAPTAFSPGTILSGEASASTFTVTPTGGATLVPITFACSGLPADGTVTCAFIPTQIAVGTSTTQTIALTVTTSGPNVAGGRAQRHQRADNRSPWMPFTLPIAGVVVVGLFGRKMSKHSAIAGLCVSLVLAGFLVACVSSSHPPVAVSISPAAATVFPNDSADNWPPQTASFTATVTNTSNMGVTWSVSPANGGSITSAGVYTAPTITAGLPASATITATSAADSTKSASATVTITPATVPGAFPIAVTVTEGPTSVTSGTTVLTVQ
jgi:hypothetical protein